MANVHEISRLSELLQKIWPRTSKFNTAVRNAGIELDHQPNDPNVYRLVAERILRGQIDCASSYELLSRIFTMQTIQFMNSYKWPRPRVVLDENNQTCIVYTFDKPSIEYDTQHEPYDADVDID